ncbi:alpha/beta fold hydrolase [Antrihabitans sp. YC2-6]|uniref:alpha/beta fold hydrolase n=1 Tax=Antrihabitans sp. YC2-6 TaxID=2799498 RepID=UPI0018F53628|nr:alpha/beta fold hydrolase [Antrihabitans sp. YC2-6]MBJ8343078.1 alpha/beta fold hydrolase [Antrihabitans sp. YC2-6]
MRISRPLEAGRRNLLRPAIIVAVLALVVVSGFFYLDRDTRISVATEDVTVTVPAGPGEPGTVAIDAELYFPATTPAPAVLLAHGFGGSKDSIAGQARQLARDGFVVLAYSARGFGKSTGSIYINDPEHEVADARELVTFLAGRSDVDQDGPGDPHVGVAGASYGGALALMLGGTDPRIDSIAAAVTWNDLGQALFPNYAQVLAGGSKPATPPTPTAPVYTGPGVLKRAWAGIFFGVGAEPVGTRPSTGLTGDLCGRFAESVCQAYAQSGITGSPTPELLDLMRNHSPAPYVRNITAPTLLIQGERDTLFGLDQADANAREIAAGGAPVEVRWFNGGHDGDAARADSTIRAWLGNTLRDDDPGSAPFNYALQGPPNEEGQIPSRRMSAADYPGLGGNAATPRTSLELNSPTASPQTIVRPPGATPGTVSSVPGVGSALSSALTVAGLDVIGRDPPGQSAMFSTKALAGPLAIVGSAIVDLRVHAFAAPGESVLFAKLYDVSNEGRRMLPGGAVSAVRLPDSPDGSPVDVRVTLPAIAYRVLEGHHIEIVVGTTDQAYAVPLNPAVFSVDLVGAQLLVPTVEGATAARSVPLAPLFGIAGIAGALGVLIVGAIVRSRMRGTADADPALADTPLVVSALTKTYSNGFRAVDGVSFVVEHGQVLGLLGPNGAGKTTTLRMVLGLIKPQGGEVRVFGHKVTPGAPVLSRLGAFVEGPGLLPHLSGIDNLKLFWRTTGRPHEDAAFDEVIRIADLGSAIERKVRSYSHGMKQRLAIAQAMLGLPDLLILDEPTNGLDPPQIRTMRDVLTEYAGGGRTVVVSSHLLAEVEQTCTHVVVMNQGKVISAGSVRDLVSAGGPTEIRVDDAARAADALADVAGLGTVIATDGDSPKLRIDLGKVAPADVVRRLVDAGVAVSSVASSTKLEDVFLALVHDPRATREPEKDLAR